jgi:hypothetical protein
MKRTMKIFLAMLICVCAACGKKETKPAAEPVAALKTKEETKEEPVDLPVGDMLVTTEEEPVPEETGSETEKEPDIDITFMSPTAIYSEVYNMIMEPEKYEGKYIRICGMFAVGESWDGREMYGCIIPDATQCCVQGIEFLWKGDHTYPDDYPEPGTRIVVEGTFAYERPDEYSVAVRLEDADMRLE